MSGICGWVGAGVGSELLDAMLAAIEYRGDSTDRVIDDGIALGYRFWKDRPGKSPAIHREDDRLVACAGTFAPPLANPAGGLGAILDSDEGLAALDGGFAAACWDRRTRRLRLVRDPFGVRSLYYVEHGGILYFASEVKQLLCVPGLPVEMDPLAIHKYLSFSFVPGAEVPIRGIHRLLPGRIARWCEHRLEISPYFNLRESLDPELSDQPTAVRRTRRAWRTAVANRLNGEERVGVFLSGGIDSSGVALWLKQAGVDVRCFTLDFGEAGSELAHARLVATELDLPLELVPADGARIEPVLQDLVWKLDLPFGDPVTGPQYLLGRTARAAGLSAVFNGEGGDQLFGGWTNKPMISAEIYADLFQTESREEMYLRSYHRFYGREEALYTPSFRAQVGGPGARRAHLQPYLSGHGAKTFLSRMRLADTELKGSQNILPRAERTANAWGLDVRVPLFDRRLAELAFSLPPQLKLHGASEKHVLKLVLQPYFPAEIVWRRKFGMGVPITEWVLGALAPTLRDLLGRESLERRGLFRPEYVGRLLAGENDPGEMRRRRVGEKLWTLAMLEAWLRIFVDGRGRRPS